MELAIVWYEVEHEDTLQFRNVNQPAHLKHTRVKHLPLPVLKLNPQLFNLTQLTLTKLSLLIVHNNLALLEPLAVNDILVLIVSIYL